MRLRVVSAILLALLLAGAAAAFLNPASFTLLWRWTGLANMDPKDSPRPPREAASLREAAHSPAQLETPAGAAFDIVRLARDSGGTSVFAGHAPPGAFVTVLIDGEPVGTVQADADGAWSFALDRGYPGENPRLDLRLEPNDAARAAGAPSSQQASAEPAPAAPPPASQLLKKFEEMVDAARRGATTADAASQPLPEAGNTENAGNAGKQAAAASPPGASSATTIPLPMTFIYREAEFTPEGRRAARLLLDYLKLKKYSRVSLSGHADDVGSPAYNMELSRKRLETVARFLHEGGFSGKLELIPKGETEPFRGVDRTQTPLAELRQLDRRVELRSTR